VQQQLSCKFCDDCSVCLLFQRNTGTHQRLNDVPDHLSPEEAAMTARYGITKFSDLTPDEFQGYCLLFWLPKVETQQKID
jgi:hypothetical protein